MALQTASVTRNGGRAPKLDYFDFADRLKRKRLASPEILRRWRALVNEQKDTELMDFKGENQAFPERVTYCIEEFNEWYTESSVVNTLRSSTRNSKGKPAEQLAESATQWLGTGHMAFDHAIFEQAGGPAAMKFSSGNPCGTIGAAIPFAGGGGGQGAVPPSPKLPRTRSGTSSAASCSGASTSCAGDGLGPAVASILGGSSGGGGGIGRAPAETPAPPPLLGNEVVSMQRLRVAEECLTNRTKNKQTQI